MNKTPDVLVSGGSGTKWRAMAQQGPISSFWHKRRSGQSRLSHGGGVILGWWRKAGLVWVSACEGE